MPHLLDDDLLHRLESAWREQGAEIADVLAPGLDVREAEERVHARLGVTLPTEARRWFGWHDGTESSTPHGWDVGPYVSFYSLSDAFEVLDLPFGAGGETAPSTWLPIAQAPGGLICIDCADPEVAVVHRIDYEVGFRPGAASMGEMVLLWLEMYESGAWSWNPAGYWNRDFDKAPSRIDGMYVV